MRENIMKNRAEARKRNEENAKKAAEENEEGMKQEECLKRIEQMFPEVYKGLMRYCEVQQDWEGK